MSEFGRRVLSTETIRHMDRDELTDELAALGITIDESVDEGSDHFRSVDLLRDDLCAALESAGDPDENRGDYMRDSARDREL